MSPADKPIDDILRSLQERAKELECLYRIEELLKQSDAPLERIFGEVACAIPTGWQYPQICRARIAYQGATYHCADFKESSWVISAEIVVQEQSVGRVSVYYTEQAPRGDEGPFIKEERRLIDAIADRLGHFLAHRKLQRALRHLQTGGDRTPRKVPANWWVILDFLKRTDRDLLMRLARKMLNHLWWSDIPEALVLLQQPASDEDGGGRDENENRPRERRRFRNDLELADETFRIAANHLSEDEILSSVQKWIKEDNSRFLVQALGSADTGLEEIADAVRRYHHMAPGAIELSPSVQKGLRVALIERFFTDQLDYVKRAKRYLEVDDFFELVQRTIFPPKSRGKLGGKSAGLFLAMQILRRSRVYPRELGEVKAPRTWYITSDGLADFIQHNSLDEVYNQKYMEIEHVRQEYPHLVQVFKNSQCSPEIVKGLSVVLDDFEGVPLIVRSSSLLEDRYGAAFSGKYKSLFLANKGSKPKRLAALVDAIAEVYASTFAPDPIQYRGERDLIDVYEEMGIMIQEVVGTRVGKYYLPAFSGVAFSHNEFRWSARIKREDGLVRMVPGLGTRAVDRVKDDYPVLLAPGQPGLRVNVTPDEVVRYSPKKIDLIDLETETFETVTIDDLLRAHGAEYPQIRQIVSLLDDDHVRAPMGLDIDFGREHPVVTFEGLIRGTPFMKQIHAILDILKTELGTPVDIEFASDGRDLYLLQCRPQSHLSESTAAPIPRDLPSDKIVFSANRFISNGKIPNITHIVYVDANRYAELTDLEDLKAVGRAIGRLNNVLPKRQFVLMGPGRWGSRGDIKLGVNVTYSDINNCAVLVEIAMRKGNYLPDLSFGTHFFQDLVESSIRYIPLYPDDAGIVFNTPFLTRAENILAELLPEFAQLEATVRVIDVPRVTKGQVLRVLMNADLDEAVGVLAPPEFVPGEVADRPGRAEAFPETHWRWRLRFAERIAAEMDPERFGVKALYLIGSTKNATAGPASDIDLLVHFTGTEPQRHDLELWFEGWSHSLGEMNYLRTGYRTGPLLDVHVLTEEDFEERTSFALKIGAVTDPARALPLKSWKARAAPESPPTAPRE